MEMVRGKVSRISFCGAKSFCTQRIAGAIGGNRNMLLLRWSVFDTRHKVET
jgi:hypothetical protein